MVGEWSVFNLSSEQCPLTSVSCVRKNTSTVVRRYLKPSVLQLVISTSLTFRSVGDKLRRQNAVINVKYGQGSPIPENARTGRLINVQPSVGER